MLIAFQLICVSGLTKAQLSDSKSEQYFAMSRT